MKVLGSNPAAVYSLLGLCATGMLQPALKLKAKQAPQMAALPFSRTYFSVLTNIFNQQLLHPHDFVSLVLR